jgi:DNA-binding LacI/PurR family transcriptional regulator
VSDDRLAAELARRLQHAPTTVSRAMRDYASIALGTRMQVPGPADEAR